MSGQRATAADRRWAAACALVAVAAFYNTMDAQFVYDDARAIVQNGDLLPSSPLSNLLLHDFWGTPLSHSGSHKSFRPVCSLTFRLNALLFGLTPASFHVVNVLLHGAVTYLVVAVGSALFPSSRATAVLSGLMFALHPVHCEAVAGIVGRADLLAALFFLLALLRYRAHVVSRDAAFGNISCHEGECAAKSPSAESDKNGNTIRPRTKGETTEPAKDQPGRNRTPTKHLALTVLLSALAMFSKEQGITVLGVCFVADALDLFHADQKQPGGKALRSTKTKSLFFLASAAVALLSVRMMAMGSAPPSFSRADNPAATSESLLTRTLTFLLLPALNMGLLLCPAQLSFDWSMDAVPLVESVWDWRNLQTLAFFGLLAWSSARLLRLSLSRSPNAPQLLLCVVMLVLPFVPASNLFFYVGFVLAERVLYLPSVGFCLLSAHAAVRALGARRQIARRLAAICVALLLLAFGLRTLIRNRDWQDEESLYTAGLAINPPKAFGNLGNVLTQKGRLVEAEAAFLRALQYRPNMADVHYNLGVLYQNENRLSEAEEAYKRAIQFRPKLVLAHLNLGLVQSSLGRATEAMSVLSNVERIDDDGLKDPRTHKHAQVSALFNLGRMQLESGQPAQALRTLTKAEAAARDISYEHMQSVYNLLGEAHQTLNDTDAAERFYRKAVAIKPEHIPAYLKYGKMLAKNKTRFSEAESWFSKAHSLAPLDASVHLHYGLFLMDADRNAEAAAHFERAASLGKPADFESVFNAAVAFRMAGRNDRAEHYYRRAANMKPEDASAHMNLGAMLHLVGKLEEAETEYLSAWSLNPDDDHTRMNLNRLHKVMRSKGMRVRETPH